MTWVRISYQTLSGVLVIGWCPALSISWGLQPHRWATSECMKGPLGMVRIAGPHCCVVAHPKLGPYWGHNSLHCRLWYYKLQVTSVCVCACAWACLRAYAWACLHACVRACLRACVRACVRVCECVHVYVCVPMYVSTGVHDRSAEVFGITTEHFWIASCIVYIVK